MSSRTVSVARTAAASWRASLGAAGAKGKGKGKFADFDGSRPLSTAAPPPNLTSESAPLTPRPPIPSEVKRSRRPEAAAEEDDDSAPAARALSTHSLSLLYAFSTPPPLSALSAFASRLALSASSSSASASLASHLPLLEQCLIHPSFWEGVRDLPPRSPSSPARQHTHFHDSIARDSHNAALATLGNALLGTLASELLLSSFPVLPTQVLKAACTMYVGPKSLAAVGGSWGIGPSRLDRRLVGGGVDGVEGRESKKDRAYAHLVGGVGGAKKGVEGKDGAAGMGLVRWNRRPTTPLKDAVLYEDALASVSRAVVGAIYQTHGFAATRAFVHAQFLSRLLPSSPASLTPSAAATSDITPLLKFSSPSRVLSLTLQRQARPTPVHRLLKESGRLSSHATFLSGVFSGEEKLGEGFGSSISMSEWRASEDALRRVYLGGRTKGGLPSDAWVGGAFEGLRIGEVEVDQESAGRGKAVVQTTA